LAASARGAKSVLLHDPSLAAGRRFAEAHGGEWQGLEPERHGDQGQKRHGHDQEADERGCD